MHQRAIRRRARTEADSRQIGRRRRKTSASLAEHHANAARIAYGERRIPIVRAISSRSARYCELDQSDRDRRRQRSTTSAGAEANSARHRENFESMKDDRRMSRYRSAAGSPDDRAARYQARRQLAGAERPASPAYQHHNHHRADADRRPAKIPRLSTRAARQCEQCRNPIAVALSGSQRGRKYAGDTMNRARNSRATVDAVYPAPRASVPGGSRARCCTTYCGVSRIAPTFTANNCPPMPAVPEHPSGRLRAPETAGNQNREGAIDTPGCARKRGIPPAADTLFVDGQAATHCERRVTASFLRRGSRRRSD